MTHDNEQQLATAVIATTHMVLSLVNLDPSGRKALTQKHRESLTLASKCFAQASAYLARIVDDSTPKE